MDKKWGVRCICKGMMAGLAREGWLKVGDDDRRFEGTQEEAEKKAKELRDSDTGISRLNLSYGAEPLP